MSFSKSKILNEYLKNKLNEIEKNYELLLMKQLENKFNDYKDINISHEDIKKFILEDTIKITNNILLAQFNKEKEFIIKNIVNKEDNIMLKTKITYKYIIDLYVQQLVYKINKHYNFNLTKENQRKIINDLRKNINTYYKEPLTKKFVSLNQKIIQLENKKDLLIFNEEVKISLDKQLLYYITQDKKFNNIVKNIVLLNLVNKQDYEEVIFTNIFKIFNQEFFKIIQTNGSQEVSKNKMINLIKTKKIIYLNENTNKNYSSEEFLKLIELNIVNKNMLKTVENNILSILKL